MRKKGRSKYSFLKALREILTQNWGLKLLALALAILIYHSLKTEPNNKPSSSNERTIFSN